MTSSCLSCRDSADGAEEATEAEAPAAFEVSCFHSHSLLGWEVPAFTYVDGNMQVKFHYRMLEINEVLICEHYVWMAKSCCTAVCGDKVAVHKVPGLSAQSVINVIAGPCCS